ncbi:hypothetical protein [Methanosarcina barkeri]|uniref:hypothetical protein n=1 Tax=Methanosarcina barkeri TaxID=2208 RepID=UPI001FB2B985|nr:hypothetical protein [Methanosarcina barkeri]
MPDKFILVFLGLINNVIIGFINSLSNLISTENVDRVNRCDISTLLCKLCIELADPSPQPRIFRSRSSGVKLNILTYSLRDLPHA